MALDQALLSKVLAAIQADKLTWTPRPTSMLQLTAAERRIRLGYKPAPGELTLQQRELASATQGPQAPTPARALSPSCDWRHRHGRNFVSAVKDQFTCGSCVAFGTTAAIDAAMRIRKDLAVGERGGSSLFDLSEAQLFYCGAESKGFTCLSGWDVTAALSYCTETGLAPEHDFPYTPGDQACNLKKGWQERVTQLSETRSLTAVADMKSSLAHEGPLVTCLSVYEDFYVYGKSSGVYKRTSTAAFDGGHCVCVVGYDDARQAWICKNSWGTDWGEDGFFLIAYGECGIDAAMWAISGFKSIYQVPHRRD